MTTHPSVICANDSVAHAARVMRNHRIGMLPVVDDLCHRRLVGVVTDRDLVLRGTVRGMGPSNPVSDVMTARDLVTVDGNADVQTAFALMAKHGVRRVPVLEGDGRVIGVVSLARARHDPGTLAPSLHRSHLRRPRTPAEQQMSIAQ